MPRRHTITAHRIGDWVIIATWHGYTVTEHPTEDDAIEHIRELPQTHHYLTDWTQFRWQSPCHIPRCEIETIISYYTRNTQ